LESKGIAVILGMD
jgi:hypothetical protein